MKATISEKGQVTIPKRLRDRLDLHPGTVLEFEESGGRLVGRKLVPMDHLEDLVEILELPEGVDRFVDDIRGPAIASGAGAGAGADRTAARGPGAGG